MIGGALPLSSAVGEATRVLPDDDPTRIAAIVSGRADLVPNAAGDCTAISAGFTFEARRE